MHSTGQPQNGALRKAQGAADAIPILVDNTYHLFYLETPAYTIHHPPRLRSSWCRQRSIDLSSWTRDKKSVIAPGESETDPDNDGAWTGSAIVDLEGRMRIFYTGYSLAQGGKQVILQAVANDKHGTAFTKVLAPLHIISPDSNRLAFEDIDFRDPYVFFNEDESLYWMLVGTRLSCGPKWTRGCIALLTSANLDEWILQPEPLYAPNDMYCPECPELFKLPNGKWYLFYSRFTSPDAGTVYRVADTPYGPFRKPRDNSHGRLDGRRWYAAKSCPKAGDPSKRIFFGWIADYNKEDGKWLWGGDMAIPREVSALENGCLRIDPVREAIPASLGRSSDEIACVSIPSVKISSLGGTKTQALELPQQCGPLGYMTEFRVQHHDAQSFGVLVRTDSDMRGHRISLSLNGDNMFDLTLLTDLPPLDDFWADQYRLYLPRNIDGPEIVRHRGVSLERKIRLIVSGALIQLFCGGRSITYRVPIPEGSKPVNGAASNANDHNALSVEELAFFVEDGEVYIDEIQISR